MKNFLIWFAVFITVVVAYNLITDMVGWLFKEENGALVRYFCGFLAMTHFLVKATDYIVRR